MWITCFWKKALFLYLLALACGEAEEEGYEEDGEDGGGDDAAEYAGTDCFLGSCACTMGKRKGDNACAEGEGCHQDGAEAEFGGGDGGLHDVHAVPVEVFGDFDDEDSVFGGEADGGDEADFEVDIVGHFPQEDSQQGTDEAEGYDQDDCERNGPAFIQGCQYKEDDEDGEGEQDGGLGTSLLFFIGLPGPFEPDSLGQGGGDLLHGFHGVAAAFAGCGGAVDSKRGIVVVARQLRGACRPFEIDKG